MEGEGGGGSSAAGANAPLPSSSPKSAALEAAREPTLPPEWATAGREGAPAGEWATSARATLAAARARLASSNNFAFFAFDGRFFSPDDGAPTRAPDGAPAPAQALFEDQQAALEGEAERLSGLLQAAPGAVPGGAAGLRFAVLNSAASVERRVAAMFDAASEFLAPLTAPGTDIAPYVPADAAARGAAGGARKRARAG